MHSPHLTLLALLHTLALTTTIPLYTATLHTHPTPTPLALLTYSPHHPSLSHLLSYTPPPNTTTDPTALTQIAIYFPNADPSSPHYRTSATSIRGFHAPYAGRFTIVVDPDDGGVVGASWRCWVDKGGRGSGNGKGDFDIVTVKRAPSVVFDKPGKEKGGLFASVVGKGAEVEGEEEVVEKTLLQK
jgi:hypothetical protein